VGTWGTSGEQRISWCHLALVKGVLYVNKNKKKKEDFSSGGRHYKTSIFPPFSFLSKTPVFGLSNLVWLQFAMG
jgi:hypothetical protein